MQKAGAAGTHSPQKAVRQPNARPGENLADGRWLSWLAPKDGVLNICVAPAGDMNAVRVITNDTKRGIRFHGWALDSSHILYIQDEGGTEEWHIYAVDVDPRTTQDLTPLTGVSATSMTWCSTSLDCCIAINDRDKAWHDVYRIDIRTGERELIVENTQELAEHRARSPAAPEARDQSRAPKAAAACSASTARCWSRCGWWSTRTI